MSELKGVGSGGSVLSSTNPCNRGGFNGESRKNRNNVHQSARERFQIIQEKMHESIQKHVQQEYESSSDEESLETEPILRSVLKDYSLLNKSLEGVEKIHQFLESSFQSGSVTCLICLSAVKRIDPIWSCFECYGFFHLVCIQRWAKDSIFQQNQAQIDLPHFKKAAQIYWPCPKCRHEFQENNIPEKYYCFCGATQDPAYQPFLVPHSCGERCNKLLKPECGHSCLLLCHPGPCPPCPKTVEVQCHCQKEGPKVRRCNNKFWSCGIKCGKPLSCNNHFCEKKCHPGDCPLCNKVSIQKCNCGQKKREQPCMTPTWECGKVCGKPFSCGYHSCSVVCHNGSCGDCPRSLIRTCPCGKTESQLPCTKEIPSCNETCGKLLKCGAHYCSQKCHKDECGMCFELVRKVCRCGQSKKELPCEKEFLCGSKCKRLRNCSRHPCSRKCCDMNCPPCEKQCSRTLSCGNHKCPSVCHKGMCYPCPEVIEIRCRCGSSVISVPCGREKKAKPPKCNNLCLIPPNCHHTSREQHKCHYGKCPPCNQICGKDRKNCAHSCPATCHSSVWQKVNEIPCPAGPWEAAQFQMKRFNLPCPDCEVPVPVTCFGGHETAERPCFRAESFSCGRPCGRLLNCGNHKCEKVCHLVSDAGDSLGESCSKCELDCTKERPKGCTHKCIGPCHSGDCPPCKMSLKMKCHCSVSVLHMCCGDYFSASDEERNKLLTCGNPCPKKYSCGHPCVSICHTGDCPEPEMCKKKVKVSCKCGNFKRLISCDSARKDNLKLVDCVESCQRRENKSKKGKEAKSEDNLCEERKRDREQVGKMGKKFEGRIENGRKIRSTNSMAVKFLSSKYSFFIASAIAVLLAAAIVIIS